MKRVLAVVACGSLHLAPCQASSGWGAAGSATGAGGSWPSVPPDGPPNGPPQGPPANKQSNSQPPVDPANYYHSNAPAGGEGFAATDGTAGYHDHDPHTYHHDPQQQQPHQQPHQQQPSPPYEPPYIPQQSRWAGQHRQPHQHQHQHQHHYPQHEGYPPPSGGGGGSGGAGQPLHLGTKWRNMVSRVKDAVRPGQPPPLDYGRAEGGYQAGYDGGGGGWAEGGGAGASGYSPPGSSWVGAANQNQRYSPPQGVHSGHSQPSANTGYGGDYDQPPAAAAAADYGGYPPGGSDGAAARFDGHGQQHHAPPPETYFDRADSSAQSPGPPPQPAQAPDVYAESNVDGSSSSSSGHGYKTGGTEGYDGSGGGDQHASMISATMSEGQRVAVGGGLPAREPSFEPQQPAAPLPATVGQGWSTPGTSPTPVVTPHQGSVAASEGADHGNGATMAPVPDGSAWAPPGGQSGSVQDSGPKTAVAPRPPGEAAMATASESRVEPSEPAAAATGAFGGGGSYRADQGTTSLDTMPSSADHGMEKVDWGTGAEEAEGEGETDAGAGEVESGETVVGPGSEERLELEREEEALIRELERMDSTIENGDSLLVAGSEEGGVGAINGRISNGSSGSLPSSSPPAAPVEDQAMIDEAVEHQLDDIFDSIILDEEVDVDIDFEVDVDSDSADAAAAAAAAEGGEYAPVAQDRPAMMPSAAESGAAEPVAGEGWGLFDGGTADAARQQQPAVPLQGTQTAPADPSRTPGDPQPRAHKVDVPLEGTPTTGSARSAGATGAEGASTSGGSPPPSASAPQAAVATVSDAEVVGSAGGSLWGSTSRWDSLPPQPNADASDSEEAKEEEEEEEEEVEFVERVEADVQELNEVDDEDEADVRVPLDPIELPPSAATDEIWNDQHLQDQLDAYWEQSRRGGAAAAAAAGAGAGAGAGPPPSGVQQLSAYGSGEPHLEPTYGPGDWVGGSGDGALLPEPLPGSVAPRLFQGGNQAPINIYGNVHVHLQQSGGDQQQQQGGAGRPSAEMSARERYYSQGETSWSGSERGGQ